MFSLLEREILRICRYNYKDFLGKANVLGLGLACKETNRIKTFERCIQVFVEKKLPLKNLNSYNVIPPFYHGIKTDVIETGIFKRNVLTQRIRPTLGGCSISPSNRNYYGTLGCLVTKHNQIFILSNNHVLSDLNTLPLYTSIVQPGVPNGGRSPFDIIAYLSDYVPLLFNAPGYKPENLVDAAIAVVSDTSLVSPYIFQIGPPKGIASVSIGSQVQMVGATTGYDSGEVTAIGATFVIDEDPIASLMIDQVITTPMGDAGDSGSLVLDFNNNAVGLYFGGSFFNGYFSPINNVLSSLNVSLIICN